MKKKSKTAAKPKTKTKTKTKIKTRKSAKSVTKGSDSGKVEKGKVISFHYSVADERGAVLESSRGEDPLFYLHGHGQIVPGLERALNGKELGEKLKVTVPPKLGYGEYDESLVVKIDRERIPDSKQMRQGDMLHIRNKEGESTVLRVTKVHKTFVTADGNHPFAGKTLRFSIEIVGIRNATKEELAHGHAHTPGGKC